MVPDSPSAGAQPGAAEGPAGRSVSEPGPGQNPRPHPITSAARRLKRCGVLVQLACSLLLVSLAHGHVYGHLP